MGPLAEAGDPTAPRDGRRWGRRDGCTKFLGAIWGFTRPFERIWRFWRIEFVRKRQKPACFENRVKSDSRRLQNHIFLSVSYLCDPAWAVPGLS
jgi:hypothetical protein